MAIWTADGGLTAYDAATGALKQNTITLYDVASPVDANFVTRLHRPLAGPPPVRHQVSASVPLTIWRTDWEAARDHDYGISYGVKAVPDRGYASAGMVVVPASYFPAGSVPTKTQILNSVTNPATQKFRATTRVEAYPAAGGRDVDFFIPGPGVSDLQPGTKYWVLVFPSVVPDNLSRFNTGYDDVLDGNSVETKGRAASFWTNRRPNAPTITSPASGSAVAGGSTLPLSFEPSDPDATSGSSLFTYSDLAGVQVQYAPRPSRDNPNPVWVDLPFASGLGWPTESGWYIDAKAPDLPGVGFFGAYQFKENRTATLRCGASVGTPLDAMIPSGDWQLRMRTFDYAHPFPALYHAWAKEPRSAPEGSKTVVTPDSYGDDYASPWSPISTLSVLAQVPPPVPVSPVRNSAVPVHLPVTLAWRYRNTHVDNYAQASRLVQMRAVGAADWIDVADGPGSAPSVVVPSTLLVGTQYEWRVQVTDSDPLGGVTSNFSSVERFWVIAAPAPGDSTVLPTGTIPGATLGCGTHRAFIFRRGGTQVVGEIRGLSSVSWGRVRDDISEARITVSDWDVDCGTLLANLQTWAYELVLFRDNGYSVDRVWEGPITLLTYKADEVVIKARDVLVYAYRRIIREAMSDTQNPSTVVDRAARVLQNAFAPDDPNILQYLQPILEGDIAKQRRSAPPYSRSAFEEIDDMASNAGLDYTAVGRAILLWGTRHRIGLLPEFRDEDLGSTPIVSEYGMSTANRYVVSDGNGIYGIAEAGALKTAGEDNDYGLLEMLSSSWSSDADDEDAGVYTQEKADEVRETFRGYAESSVASRFPPPVVVRVPDNTTLNPGAVISIQQLVPGVAVPLRSSGTLREVRATQKLDALSVREEAGVETVSITLSPFTSQDNEIEEGGGEE